jgi:hypothetical protein
VPVEDDGLALDFEFDANGDHVATEGVQDVAEPGVDPIGVRDGSAVAEGEAEAQPRVEGGAEALAVPVVVVVVTAIMTAEQARDTGGGIAERQLGRIEDAAARGAGSGGPMCQFRGVVTHPEPPS